MLGDTGVYICQNALTCALMQVSHTVTKAISQPSPSEKAQGSKPGRNGSRTVSTLKSRSESAPATPPPSIPGLRDAASPTRAYLLAGLIIYPPWRTEDPPPPKIRLNAQHLGTVTSHGERE